MTRIKSGLLSKVTTGGRITIPKKVRKKQNIEKGDYVWILVEKPSFDGPGKKSGEEEKEEK